MARKGLPPYFKFSLPTGVKQASPVRGGRESPRQRGYDARWDRLSLRYRRANPWCRFCEQEGADHLADLVDHIMPVELAPELRYEWSNLQSLCTMHHSGLKQRMEIYARQTSQTELLRVWCDDPDTRPPGLRVF